MDSECEGPESEAEDYMDWHAKEDEMMNTAPCGTAQYLRNEVWAYHLRKKRKEANDANLGKVKANGHSGGSAAPKQDREAKDKEVEPCIWPCNCENCMSWEKYKLFNQGQGEGDGQGQGEGEGQGKGKESSAVADKGQHELKRETAKETHTRPS